MPVRVARKARVPQRGERVTVREAAADGDDANGAAELATEIRGGAFAVEVEHA
jgi:hypothetical protein